MSNKLNISEYKLFLESKIKIRKEKIYDAIEREFLIYLENAKIASFHFDEEVQKNFTVFFTKIIKNVFFSSLFKKMNDRFSQRILDFQKKSYQSFVEKKFNKVVLLSDVKVTKYDKGINEFVKTVTDDWHSDLIFRSLPLHDHNWLFQNIVAEINRDLVIKSIDNVINSYPKHNLILKYFELNDVDQNLINTMWKKFVDTKVWYSYERYIKAFEMLEDREIVNQLNSIYELIDNKTLLVINNNDRKENKLFDFLFNFENELFNYINMKQNLSIVISSDHDAYQKTFLGLISLANITNIGEIENMVIDKKSIKLDEIKTGTVTIEDKHATVELFSDKTDLPKSKKRKRKPKKNITDITGTVALTQMATKEETTGTLDKFWSDTKTIDNNLKTSTLETLQEIKNSNDDLVLPDSHEGHSRSNFLNNEIKNILNENINNSKKSKKEISNTIATIDFGEDDFTIDEQRTNDLNITTEEFTSDDLNTKGFKKSKKTNTKEFNSNQFLEPTPSPRSIRENKQYIQERTVTEPSLTLTNDDYNVTNDSYEKSSKSHVRESATTNEYNLNSQFLVNNIKKEQVKNSPTIDFDILDKKNVPNSMLDLEVAVLSSRKISIFDQIRFKAIFDMFTKQFEYFMSQHRTQFNNMTHGDDVTAFNKELHNLNDKAASEFIEKNVATIFNVLYTKSITENELLKYYSIYLFIKQKSLEVEKIINSYKQY